MPSLNSYWGPYDGVFQQASHSWFFAVAKMMEFLIAQQTKHLKSTSARLGQTCTTSCCGPWEDWPSWGTAALRGGI